MTDYSNASTTGLYDTYQVGGQLKCVQCADSGIETPKRTRVLPAVRDDSCENSSGDWQEKTSHFHVKSLLLRMTK